MDSKQVDDVIDALVPKMGCRWVLVEIVDQQKARSSLFARGSHANQVLEQQCGMRALTIALSHAENGGPPDAN